MREENLDHLESGVSRPASTSGAAHRWRLGRLGEEIAAAFLARQGVRIIARNVGEGRGEMDIVASDDSGRFVVEVKTAMARPDDHPRWHFTEAKARQVAGLARSRSIGRVDLVTVVVGAGGVRIDWHRRVA